MFHQKTDAKVLALMPMLPGYEAVRETVATTIAEEMLSLVWLDELLEDWEWLEWLFSSVSACDLIIANPTKHNPFVMYELGVAYAYRKPTILILDGEDTYLSGSLDGSPFLVYSVSELEEFSSRLRNDISLIVNLAANEAVSTFDPDICYRDATSLGDSFADETGTKLNMVNVASFNARLKHSLKRGTFIPALKNTAHGDAGLLAALIRSSRMVDTMTAIRNLIDLRSRS